jgi:hypothetical protein
LLQVEQIERVGGPVGYGGGGGSSNELVRYTGDDTGEKLGGRTVGKGSIGESG